MIERTGWENTAHGHQTVKDFETLQNMYAKEQANIDELERVHGREGAAELLARRARTFHALERGLLRREVFTVVSADFVAATAC